MNILTFDIEEWFHLLDFEATSSDENWDKFEVRIYDNVNRIFQILDETDTKASFFFVGWIARKYPDIVRMISDKYQIGAHTMNHQLIWQMNRRSFSNDIDSSVKLLEDISGKPVKLFRAPGFSINETMGWAFETLAEHGITTDCSVFPARHSHGGMPSYGQKAHGIITPSLIRHNGSSVREFPIPVKMIAGKPIIYSGGGYFRLFPYHFIKRCMMQNCEYNLSYIHPRDLDASQPVIKGLPLERRFKSYVGLKSAEHKFRRLLSDFDFVDIKTAEESIDWTSAPMINL